MNTQSEYDERPAQHATVTQDKTVWAEPKTSVAHTLQDAQLSVPERELVERLIHRLRQL